MLAYKLRLIVHEKTFILQRHFSDTALLSAEYSLWSIGHAEARQVSIRDGEQSHDDNKGTVMTEQGYFGVLDVTRHEQRDEDQARKHSNGKPETLLRRLYKHPETIKSAALQLQSDFI